MRKLTIVLAVVAIVASLTWQHRAASAADPGSDKPALKSQTVTYKQGDVECKSYLVYAEKGEAKRPGVLVVPEIWGLNDYAKKRADQLAAMGYVALAVDIFGDGQVTTDFAKAMEWGNKMKGDRPLLRARVIAGLDELKKQPNVDPGKIAAIGYCFGGTTVLELARSGAEIAGIVSFHGGLDNPKPDDAKNVKCKVLACHGANDDLVNPDVPQFLKEMREAKVDFQFISYSDAVHGFTNPGYKPAPGSPVAYNEKADKRSWEAMKQFFAEIFASGDGSSPKK